MKKWQTKPLGEMAPIGTTPVLPTETPDRRFFYVALENIESGTGRLVGETACKGQAIKSNKFAFDTAHVLLGKLRPYLNKIVVPDSAGICSTDILPLRPKPDILTREFLALCLRSPEFIEYSRMKMEGAKMPRLRTPDLESYEIPVPPLAEQRRIVARVEALTRRLDQARQARQAAIAETQHLIASELNHIVSVGDLPNRWQRRAIRDCVQPKEMWSARQRPRQRIRYIEIASIDNERGLITTFSDIKASEAPSRAKKTVRSGDVIFATTRPNLKNIAIVPQELDNEICSTGFCVLRSKPHVVVSQWLYAICRSDWFIEQVIKHDEKNAYPSVSDDEVLDVVIPVPPLPEQQAIGTRLDALRGKLDELQRLQREVEADLAAFTPALLAKAFREEL